MLTRNNPTYNSWRAMKSRCNNPNHSHYRYYGGRGIKVCKRWDNFENFLYDMGEKTSREYVLDRIDSDGGYYKENCRWIKKSENSKRIIHVNKYDFKTMINILERNGYEVTKK